MEGQPLVRAPDCKVLAPYRTFGASSMPSIYLSLSFGHSYLMVGGVCAAQVSLLFKELSFDYECDVAVESLAAIKRAVERINQGVPAQLKAAVSVGNDMRHMYVDRDHDVRSAVRR